MFFVKHILTRKDTSRECQREERSDQAISTPRWGEGTCSRLRLTGEPREW